MEFKKECIEERCDPKIKVTENKKDFIINNPDRKIFLKLMVDGCQIIKGVKCDWLLIDKTNGDEYFVELKGTNVKHATEQLTRSIPLLTDYCNKDKQIKAFIVCANCPPAVKSNITKCKLDLKKKYGCSLIVKEKRIEANCR